MKQRSMTAILDLITNYFYEESKIKVQRMRWLNGWMASLTQWT